jgi:prolyl oligopeptidase
MLGARNFFLNRNSIHRFALRALFWTTTPFPKFIASRTMSTAPPPSAAGASAASTVRPKYPAVARGDVVDTYHGATVPDPYRWLEDPDAEETRGFVAAQNAVTLPYLDAQPLRERLVERLSEVYNYPKQSCPGRRGERLVYSRKEGLQNQPVVYVAESLTDAKPRVLLDLNAEDPEGTTALRVSSFSECGELWACGVSKKGSDWSTVRVIRVADGSVLPDDELQWLRFTSIAWTHDGKGFYYGRYPALDVKDLGAETNIAENQKLYYHRIGTKQSEDVLVLEEPEHPAWMFGAEVSDDGDYLVVSVSESTDPVNRLYYIDLRVPEAERVLVRAIDNLDAEYSYITNDGTRFLFKTNKDAARYRVVSFDITKDAMHPDRWTDVFPEHAQDVLEAVLPVAGDKLAVVYLRDVKEELSLHNMDGSLVRAVPLPCAGSVGIRGRRDRAELFYQFESFMTPGSIYHLDLGTNETTLWHATTVPGFDPEAVEVTQQFFEAKDGSVKVPMYVLTPRGAPSPGPCLLYGYGGFSISLTPYYSAFRTVLAANLGFSVAIVNLRGGGEYGEEWHQAGMRGRKQNVFDDMIGAAEHLIATKVTTARQLAIQGGSNGGLLVAAVANQRPDLFACVIAQCGVMDMLRYASHTAGVFWQSEYGSPGDDPDHGGKASFENLLKISPVHNVVPVPGTEHPATLVTTADHDDRVCPLHSYKYIAELQHGHGARDEQQAPLLIRIEVNAGHGAGKPTSMIIKEVADIYGFAARHCGAAWKE